MDDLIKFPPPPPPKKKKKIFKMNASIYSALPKSYKVVL